jgi:KaiC/GvpD/RAD55 family RecA-like ATPase
VETLVQAARRRDEGNPLPMPIKALADQGVVLYAGTVNIFAASPGCGKSTVALGYMLQANDVKSCYACMDTPRRLTVTRAGQALTGQYQAVVEDQLEEPDSAVYEALAKADQMSCFFRSGVTSRDLAMMLGAYVEMHGAFPQLFVIDNLKNVAYEGDERGVAEQKLMEELDIIAKRTNICIVVLTHVLGAYNDGLTPIPLSGVMNQNTKEAHVVLTFTRPNGELKFAVVKNRTHENDPSGTTRHSLATNFATMQVGETTSPDAARSPRPVQRPIPGSWSVRWFQSQYEQACSSCGMIVEEGDDLAYTDDGYIGRCCE